MKTYRHTLALVFFVFVSLMLSTALDAQPIYYKHRRGYSYVKYYPPVTYVQPRVYFYNRPYVPVYYGGIGYHYQAGYFYRPYGSVFQLVAPPIGITISTLPVGYSSFYLGAMPYYYYGGIYYRPHPGNQYEVVKPPLGAVVNTLPSGAKATVIDGKKYYEQSGTYYEESINSHNKLQYKVVGTDGVLNTDSNTNNTNSNTNANDNRNYKNSGPIVGDRFDDLPSDSKAVVINGQKLYLSPSGLYYKEVIEGNKLSYEVVGE